MKFTSLYILLLSVTVTAQSFTKIKEIDGLKSAKSFSVIDGFIYLIEGLTDEIFRMDTSGTIIKKTGGYGWDEQSMDEPHDIFATGLTVYVADKNNNRILLYDKDLNFLNVYNSSEENNFNYPVSIELSKLGDLFVLSEEANRVQKIYSTGIVDISFGGFEASDFELESPSDFTISNEKIYVADNDKIKVFDYYGNSLFIQKLNFIPTKVCDAKSGIFCTDGKSIYFLSNKKETKKISLFPLIDKVNDIEFVKGKLFILTDNSILVYGEKSNIKD